MRKALVLAASLALAGSASAANFNYAFGDQKANLGWPEASADWHPHHLPSHQDANFYDMKSRYDLFLSQGKSHLKRGLKRAAVEDLSYATSIEPYQAYARRLPRFRLCPFPAIAQGLQDAAPRHPHQIRHHGRPR